MPKEEKNKFIAIRSMFISGSVRKMKDLEKQSPTHVARALGINHSRYIQKLYNPEEFTVLHLADMANLFEIDIQFIWEVVVRQLTPSLKYSKKKAG
jgi:hypothetical protein